jgi:hypothetical protein
MVLFPGLFSCIWCISWLKSFCLKILAALNHIDTFQCKELKERRGLTADFPDDTDWGRRGAEAKAEIGHPPSLRSYGGTRAES